MRRYVFLQVLFWGLVLTLVVTQVGAAHEMDVTYTITPVTDIALVTEQVVLVANEVNHDAVRINVSSNIPWRLTLAYNSIELLYYRFSDAESWLEMSCYQEFAGSRGVHDLSIDLCYFSQSNETVELNFTLSY